MDFTTILISGEIFITWGLLALVLKKNIFHAWLTPRDRRMREWSMGLLFATVVAMVTKVVISLLTGVEWSLNPDATVSTIAGSMFYDLKSVVAEELLFRGIILLLLIKYFSARTGILVMAAAFGVYHWFTFGVLGNIMGMVVVFGVTGLMGYVFGLAYVRTGSLMLPLGIHLGWNWVGSTVFSGGPNGSQLLIPDQAQSQGLPSLALHLLAAVGILWFVHARFPKGMG